MVFQTEISFAKVILEQGRDIQVGTGKMAVLDEALQAIPLKSLTHLPVLNDEHIPCPPDKCSFGWI